MVQNLRAALNDLNNNGMINFISASPYVKVVKNLIGLLREKKIDKLTKQNTREVFKLLREFFPTVDQEGKILVQSK